MWRFILTLAVACVILAWFLRHRRRQARRERLFSGPFPDDWIRILEQNVPLYRLLPEPLRNELHGHINVFLDEKNFEGCGGLEVTDEIRVTIAAQACILLLDRTAKCYPRLVSIVVYPSAYVAKKVRQGGSTEVVGEQARLGESWQHGAVVLSWDDVIRGARDIKDGHNVVLHEFAHQLDQEDGTADGTPILEQRSRYLTWARVLSQDYLELRKKAQRGRKTVIGHYGATNEAEFFAVLTETFFEKPKQLKRKHPELYDEIKEFYKVDPLAWREENG
jgi:Mlc titration factor MtfA (ptsG expression regulator)